MSEDKIQYSKGTKIYKYDDNDELILGRIIDIEDDSYKVSFERGGPFEGANKWIPYDEAHNDYVKLSPDGVITFNILNDGPVKDVAVMVHPMELGGVSPIPFAICRQDTVDIFRMATKATPVEGQVWAGISINKNNCPAECDIRQFMNCEDLDYMVSISIYKDDVIEDWLPMLFVSKFDNVLETYEKKHHGDNLVGICTSLKELLEDKGFMYDFHEAMGVIEVPFLINDDTHYLLKDVISQIEHVTVSKVYVIDYSRNINTDEFERPFKIMAPDYSKAKPEDRKLYIVGYDVDEDTPYLESMYGTADKEQIIKDMGFTVL